MACRMVLQAIGSGASSSGAAGGGVASGGRRGGGSDRRGRGSGAWRGVPGGPACSTYGRTVLMDGRWGRGGEGERRPERHAWCRSTGLPVASGQSSGLHHLSAVKRIARGPVSPLGLCAPDVAWLGW